LGYHYTHNNLYFLGILNSKVFWFFITKTSTALQGNAYRLFPHYISPFPIKTIDIDNPNEKEQHDKLVSHVNQMLDFHKKLNEANTPHEKTALQRQIDANDNQIDKLVYELYDLTDEEIGIVEGE